MARRKIPSYIADFETTTDANDCRVWSWGMTFVGSTDLIFKGTDLESFIHCVSVETSTIYFHNLKFDGIFIVDYLLRNGYKHSTTDRLRSGEFFTIISKFGSWYEFSVKWWTGHTTKFRDSLKKIPLAVSEISNAFHLEDIKGEIDYHKQRDVKYQPTDEEWEYVRKDLAIVSEALSIQFASGSTRLTVGSDALAEYKSLIGGESEFRNRFPLLSSEMDADIRSAYRGGWTYLKPEYRGEIVEQGRVYDVNSLYPHVMYESLLPYDIPEPIMSPVDDSLWVCSLTFVARLKPGYVPCIQVKGSAHFAETEYLESIDEPLTLTITSVDWDLWNEHYDIDVLSWNGGYRFKSAHGLFKQYVDKWSEIKANSTGGMRFIAKLQLNSLYGKMATNPDVTGKVPYMEDNIVKFKTGPLTLRDPVYTPIGVFVTSYARSITVSAAQSMYDRFIYADTDSLHLLGSDEPTEIKIDSTVMGAWKFEYEFKRAMFLRSKAYCEQLPDDTYMTRIAGLPRSVSEWLTIDDMLSGAVFAGKLLPRRVPGGVVLEEVDYTLNF